MLAQLDQAFDGNPPQLGAAIGTMFKLQAQAQVLMQLPTEDGLAMAGPSFELVAP